MIIYVPALLSGLEHQIKWAQKSEEYLWNGFDSSWFTEQSMMKHDQVLTSYYYSNKIKNYKKTLGIKDATLWVDSGGYTVSTKGAELDPIEVLKWQEDNADISFTLDYPPIEMLGGNQTSQGGFAQATLRLFEQNAQKTARNNEIFIKHRTNHNFRIYNIIHGVNLEYIRAWWEINGDFPFDGYALGTKPSNEALYQAFRLAFLHSVGVRERVHMLGLSGIRVIPALAYISKHVDKISFDSTSYGRGSLNRTYFLPDRPNTHISFGKDYEKGSIKNLPCQCTVCGKIDNPDILSERGTWPGTLIALHNLLLIRDWVEILNMSSENQFVKIVESMTGEKFKNSMTAQSVAFFNHYLKYGIEDAYEKYFSKKTQQEYKSRRLF